jgi:hypothetical protein
MTSVFIRLFLFLLVFTLEVKVKAEGVVLQQPENCLATADASCAVQTDSENSLELQLDKGKVVLDRETTVIRVNNHEVRLVSGTLWLRPAPHQKLVVKTEYGEARSENEFWVSREAGRMTISAILKDVEMLGKGSSEVLVVPSGLENSIGRVTKEGRASVGIPTPIQPAIHLARWARLYKGTKPAFEKEVAAFKATWLEAKGEAVDMHQALYERKLANLENAANEKAKSRQKAEARNRELREHFRRRVFGEE